MAFRKLQGRRVERATSILIQDTEVGYTSHRLVASLVTLALGEIPSQIIPERTYPSFTPAELQKIILLDMSSQPKTTKHIRKQVMDE